MRVGFRWAGEHADRFSPECAFFKVHEFGDKANVGTDLAAAFKDKCVGAPEGPVIGVDEVGHDHRHGARFPGFAVDVSGRGVQAGVVCRVQS